LNPTVALYGTGIFGLAILVKAVSVTGLFSLGCFGLKTFRWDCEILQNLIFSLFNANVLKSTKGFI